MESPLQSHLIHANRRSHQDVLFDRDISFSAVGLSGVANLFKDPLYRSHLIAILRSARGFHHGLGLRGEAARVLANEFERLTQLRTKRLVIQKKFGLRLDHMERGFKLMQESCQT